MAPHIGRGSGASERMIRSCSMPVFGEQRPQDAATPSKRKQEEPTACPPPPVAMDDDPDEPPPPPEDVPARIKFRRGDALRSSLRTAAPGELDRFLKLGISDGIVLSVRASNRELEEEDAMHDDHDSVSSDVTWMTFRAELMKKAMLKEYKRVKEAQFKKEQEELDRLLNAYSNIEDDETRKKKQQRKDSRSKACGMSRTMSTPDFHHPHYQASSNRANASGMGQLAEGDEEAEEEYSAVGPQRGQLAEEFGLRPHHKKNGAQDSVDARKVWDAKSSEDVVRHTNAHDVHAAPPPAGKLHNSNSHPELQNYIDSIVELKLQLAHKQASLDELSSKYNQAMLELRHSNPTRRENDELRKENDSLRRQLTRLQRLSVGLNGSISSHTTATAGTTLSSAANTANTATTANACAPTGLIRQLSLVNLPTLFQRKVSEGNQPEEGERGQRSRTSPKKESVGNGADEARTNPPCRPEDDGMMDDDEDDGFFLGWDDP